MPNLTRKNLEYNFNSPFLSTQSEDSTSKPKILTPETTKQTVQSETIVNLTSDFEDSDPLDSLPIDEIMATQVLLKMKTPII